MVSSVNPASFSMHKKMACLKDHEITHTEECQLQPPTKKRFIARNNYLRHSGQELKYLYVYRLSLRLPLSTHKDHVHCTAEEAHSDIIETRMHELAGYWLLRKMSLMSLDKELTCSCLEWNFGTELNQGHQQFMTLSNFIMQRSLSSWFSDQAKANRMCLLQVGAIDVAVSLLHYLQANFFWEEQPIEMQELVMSLLSFLWNLAVSTESQELVISRGGFELMVTALKSTDVENEEHHSLLAKAAGCVSKYVYVCIHLVSHKPHFT